MIWLFLILSTAFAQEAPRPEFRQENAYQLLLQLRSGVPVLNSSPTYRGKPTFDNGIIFGDGTEQTTAATRNPRYVYRSSAAVAQNATSATWETLSGSTLTVSVPASGFVNLAFSAYGFVDGTGGHCGIRVLQDGSVMGATTKGAGDGTAKHFLGFNRATAALASGTYRFVIQFNEFDGTANQCTISPTSDPWEFQAWVYGSGVLQ